MEKIYRKSYIALLLNFVSLSLLLIVIFFLLNTFFDFKIALWSSFFLAILFLFFFFQKSRIEVVISDDTLSIFLGMKSYQYDLKKVSFRSEQINNNTFILYVIDENGRDESFDLSLLGFSKYQQILEDLRIIGERSDVIKIETKKKEN